MEEVEVEVVVFFMVFYYCANVFLTSMLEKRLSNVDKEIEYAEMARADRRRELQLRIMELDFELARAEVRHQRRRRVNVNQPLQLSVPA